MLIKSRISTLAVTLILIILIIVFPDISSTGVARGLLISANVIIPSLFPFMVCVLMLIKNGINIKNRILSNILYKIFGQNFEMFFVFLLSMLGGYPVGARLINELYCQKAIDNKTADIMLMYSVNAGPAFVISVVGNAFRSQKIGIVLLASHILASVIIALICSFWLKRNNCQYENIGKISKPFSETFVKSVSEASGSMLGICSFVILFSAINSYLDYFFSNMPIIKYITFFTEVTSAVVRHKNLYFVSFLLGFSGLSIWCQVFSLSGKRKINKFIFFIGRIMHGTLSAVITKIITGLFKINIVTFSNNINFKYDYFYSDAMMFSSILIMLIVLFTFIYSKKNSGKLLNDMI